LRLCIGSRRFAQPPGIEMGEHAHHAGRLLGLAGVDGRDAPFGHRAQHDKAIGGMRHLEFGRVLGLASDLGHPVHAGGPFT